MFSKNSKNVIIIPIITFIILSLCIIIYFLITSVSHIGKIAVTIKFAPYEASVFIDNKNGFHNNTVNYIPEGEHLVEVYFNGFQLYSEKITINSQNNSIFGSLPPLSKYGREYQQQHQSEFQEIEEFSSQESIKRGEKERERWPIMKYLPYTNSAFGIGNTFDENNNFILTITASEPFVDTAINTLRSFDKDISLAEYNIRINNFNNLLNLNEFKNNTKSNPIDFIKTGYQGITQPLIVNQGVREGDYYYTTIAVGNYAGYIPITYRIILQKDDKSWKIVNTPYPILTTTNTPNISLDILNKVNQLDNHINNTSSSTGS